MRPMKDAQDALIRTLLYIAIALFLSAISGGFSLWRVALLWALAVVPGETAIIIRNVRYNRRLKQDPQT